MVDEKHTFGTARIRLEEIAAEARKKDTSLEKSLDLLEEGVRLANICTELVDHTDVSDEHAVVEVDLPVEAEAEAADADVDVDVDVDADAEDASGDHAG